MHHEVPNLHSVNLATAKAPFQKQDYETMTAKTITNEYQLMRLIFRKLNRVDQISVPRGLYLNVEFLLGEFEQYETIESWKYEGSEGWSIQMGGPVEYVENHPEPIKAGRRLLYLTANIFGELANYRDDVGIDFFILLMLQELNLHRHVRIKHLEDRVRLRSSPRAHKALGIRFDVSPISNSAGVRFASATSRGNYYVV